jgi:hypothetical protein
MRAMWEYSAMWHKANWVSGVNPSWRANGWEGWVMAPASTPGPPADANDSEALNSMGRQGWELIESELVWDFPPGTTNTNVGGQRRRYLFKRPIR